MTREEEKGKLPKPLAALLRYKYGADLVKKLAEAIGEVE